MNHNSVQSPVPSTSNKRVSVNQVSPTSNNEVSASANQVSRSSNKRSIASVNQTPGPSNKRARITPRSSNKRSIDTINHTPRSSSKKSTAIVHPPPSYPSYSIIENNHPNYSKSSSSTQRGKIRTFLYTNKSIPNGKLNYFH